MVVRKLTDDELFEITAAKLGHCNDIEQLEYIIKFTKARIKELLRQGLNNEQ